MNQKDGRDEQWSNHSDNFSNKVREDQKDASDEQWSTGFAPTRSLDKNFFSEVGEDLNVDLDHFSPTMNQTVSPNEISDEQYQNHRPDDNARQCEWPLPVNYSGVREDKNNKQSQHSPDEMQDNVNGPFQSTIVEFVRIKTTNNRNTLLTRCNCQAYGP